MTKFARILVYFFLVFFFINSSGFAQRVRSPSSSKSSSKSSIRSNVSKKTKIFNIEENPILKEFEYQENFIKVEEGEVLIINNKSESHAKIEENIYIKNKKNLDVNEVKRELKTRSFNAEDVSIVSLFRNSETGSHLKNVLGKDFQTSSTTNRTSLLNTLKSNKGKTIFLMGHVENGAFTSYNLDGTVSLSLKLNEIGDLGKKYNVDILPIGCSSGRYGGRGILNDANSIDIINRLGRSLKQRNAYDFLVDLGGDNFRIVIDQNIFINSKGRKKYYKITIGKRMQNATALTTVGMSIFIISDEEESRINKVSLILKKLLFLLKQLWVKILLSLMMSLVVFLVWRRRSNFKVIWNNTIGFLYIWMATFFIVFNQILEREVSFYNGSFGAITSAFLLCFLIFAFALPIFFGLRTLIKGQFVPKQVLDGVVGIGLFAFIFFVAAGFSFEIIIFFAIPLLWSIVYFMVVYGLTKFHLYAVNSINKPKKISYEQAHPKAEEESRPVMPNQEFSFLKKMFLADKIKAEKFYSESIQLVNFSLCKALELDFPNREEVIAEQLGREQGKDFSEIYKSIVEVKNRLNYGFGINKEEENVANFEKIECLLKISKQNS